MNHRIERKTLRTAAGAPTCELTSGNCCGDPIGPTTPATVVTRRKLWLPPGSQLVGDPFCVDVPSGDCCDTPSADGSSGIRLTKQRVLVPAWAVAGEACEVVEDCDYCPVAVQCTEASAIVNLPRWITITSFYFDGLALTETVCYQSTIELVGDPDTDPPGDWVWANLDPNTWWIPCGASTRGPRLHFPVPSPIATITYPYGQVIAGQADASLENYGTYITIVEEGPSSQYDAEFFNSFDTVSGGVEAWTCTHPSGTITMRKNQNYCWVSTGQPKAAIFKYSGDYLLLWGTVAIGSSAIDIASVAGAISWGRLVGGNLE